MMRQLDLDEMEMVSGGLGPNDRSPAQRDRESDYGDVFADTFDAVDSFFEMGVNERLIGGVAAVEGGVVAGGLGGSRAGPYGAAAGGIVGSTAGSEILATGAALVAGTMALVGELREDPLGTLMGFGEDMINGN